MSIDYISKSAENAIEQVAKVGLPKPDEPTEIDKCCIFPDDLGELSDEDLAIQRSVWTRNATNAEYWLAIADTNQTVFKIKMNHAKNDALLKLWNGMSTDSRKINNKVLEAKAEQDPEFILAEKTYLHALAIYNQFKAVLSGFDRKEKASSRELSRRIAERDAKRG